MRLLCMILILGYVLPAQAQWAGKPVVPRAVLGGGGMTVRNARFVLHGTVAQTGIGRVRAELRRVHAGFWTYPRRQSVATGPHTGNFTLGQSYPNPASSSVAIPLQLPRTAHVVLRLYDLLGREVRRPVDGILPAGRQEAVITTADLPAGTYIYVLSTASHVEQKRLVILR